jgi:hypothetical protein
MTLVLEKEAPIIERPRALEAFVEPLSLPLPRLEPLPLPRLEPEPAVAPATAAAKGAGAQAPLFDCFWLFYVSIVSTLVVIGLVSTFAMFIVACMAGFGGVR